MKTILVTLLFTVALAHGQSKFLDPIDGHEPYVVDKVVHHAESCTVTMLNVKDYDVKRRKPVSGNIRLIAEETSNPCVTVGYLVPRWGNARLGDEKQKFRILEEEEK